MVNGLVRTCVNSDHHWTTFHSTSSLFKNSYLWEFIYDQWTLEEIWTIQHYSSWSCKTQQTLRLELKGAVFKLNAVVVASCKHCLDPTGEGNF